MTRIKKQELGSAKEKWKHQLRACSVSGGGHRIVSAILPHFEDWLELLEEEGSPDFYTSQILSRHGVFGEFLNRIECRAFASNRNELRNKVGHNFCLNEIISAIINNDETRRIFYEFCRTTMKTKEEHEKNREDQRTFRSGKAPKKRRTLAHWRKD
ncbi:uncharacterized protein [Cardiocondyla obscurior]|uniref:uncharacterized protein n=1 Tax=Cardiocondyla obscurior TaxID=286306 RepID=UPI00396574DC